MSLRRSPALTVAVLAVGGLLLSSCDWAQFRFGPEGTGFNPFESTISASNVVGLQQRWAEPGASQPLSSPVVANGVAYTSSNYGGRLDAFDATTGTGKWADPIGSGNYAGFPSPAVANGVIYAVAGDGTFYAIDAASGTRLWSHSLDAGTAPVVVNGSVYVVNGYLNAFNATTGALLWSAPPLSAWREPIIGTPAVANGVVYVVDGGDGSRWGLDAFDATTGKGLWFRLGSTIRPYGSPAVANGVVYVGSDQLSAFSATSGAALWSASIGYDGYLPTSPAVANGVVYDSGGDGKLHAFNASTGAAVWSASIGGGASSPVVANGVVYVVNGDGKLTTFNATAGSQLWSSTETVPGTYGGPVVANGVVYVGSDDGHLYAFSLPVPGAALTVSPTFGPDYGTLVEGTTSPPTTFTVTNFGSSASTAVSDTLTGADPTQFHLTSDTCTGVTLAGGASCTIEITFAPTLPGNRTAALTVHAGTGGATSATLSGTGNPLTIDPPRHDYGFVLDGTKSAPTSFTVTNHGASPISPTIGSLTGSQFTATADTCRGSILSANATCSVAVVFTPTGIGPISATLSASGTPGVTTTSALSGIGTPVAIAPPRKNYGIVPVGSSAPVTFTITNVTSALQLPLRPSSVTGSGFSITSDACNGTTLAASASCSVVVTFAPSVAGTAYRGQLTVAVPFIGTLNQATLVGTGG